MSNNDVNVNETEKKPNSISSEINLSEIYQLCGDITNDKYVLPIEHVAECMSILEKLNIDTNDAVKFLLSNGITIEASENPKTKEQIDKNLDGDHYLGIINMCVYGDDKKIYLERKYINDYISKGTNSDALMHFINMMEIIVID